MHQSLARILVDTGIVKCEPEEAFNSNLTVPFCPHGLGHLLGIQVHDVGGQQLDIDGQTNPPRAYASLRLTRPLAENMVITVEPGLYFIPILLEKKRAEGAPIDWRLVELLIPFGGIRIEDNVRLLPKGAGSREFDPRCICENFGERDTLMQRSIPALTPKDLFTPRDCGLPCQSIQVFTLRQIR